MLKIRVASDVFKAVLCSLGGKSLFPADIPEIHRFFFHISKQPEFSSLFDGIIFDDSQSYPYSKTITFAIDRLEKGSLLACLNPRLEKFQISDKLAAQKDDMYDLFSDVEQKQIKEISDRFKSSFAENSIWSH